MVKVQEFGSNKQALNVYVSTNQAFELMKITIIDFKLKVLKLRFYGKREWFKKFIIERSRNFELKSLGWRN